MRMQMFTTTALTLKLSVDRSRVPERGCKTEPMIRTRNGRELKATNTVRANRVMATASLGSGGQAE